MIVLHVINAPVATLGARILSRRTSTAYDLILAFAEVAVNGALYGLVAAVIVAAWRGAFHKPRSI